ncbi:MAG: NAD(P)/FAD-dependent oxidoreductase [Pseudomonadota bacterium]
MDRVDAIVVGAGVVGLAVGKALAESGRETLVLERHDIFGSETSSRNSEVIHAGIYYRPGGYRAQFCHPGKQMLYAYAEEKGVDAINCGKLIVCHGPDEVARLEAIIGIAAKNGVDDLRLIDRKEALEREPALACYAAIHSPSTGIIDSHNLMLALQGDLEAAGGSLVLTTEITGGRVEGDGIVLQCGGEAAFEIKTDLLINSAGLHSERLARSIDGLDPAHIPHIQPAKGDYFAYAGKAPFSHLIYPLHTADSQGIHYTRDLGGQGRLGPDIDWGMAIGDYDVDPAKRDQFADAALKFWPGLDREKLHASYAGQRPKASGPGEEGDFKIWGPETHGTKGYIGLYAIESPGLTSCLAIGRYVDAMARQMTDL